MSLKRRDFIRRSAGKAALGAALFQGLSSFKEINPTTDRTPDTNPGLNTATTDTSTHNPSAILNQLTPLTGDIVPITLEERLTRIQKAQKLMAENKIEALILDTGTSMQYFTGVGWWPSERTMVAIIPAKGEI